MPELLSTPTALNLRDLLAGARFTGTGDIRVTSYSTDSRTCSPGDLFVALGGTQCDGHDFAAEAVVRGCSAVVTQRTLNVNGPQCIVGDTREALGQICQALVGQPSRSLKVIGVTGTNGKTTTTQLIASILTAAGYRVGTLGTLGYCDSFDTERASLTTPDAPTLARWLARMKARDCSHAVIEVSSHAIAQRRIAGVDFAQACLTNLRRDHLDYHPSLAEYHRTKIELFAHLTTGGTAVINADDSASVEHAPMLPGRVHTIAMQNGADLMANVVERLRSEQTFMLTAGKVTCPVRTTMIGDHHVYNCLMAAAVGLAQGIELPTIVRGIESVARVAGRLERIECGQPFGVFVDFAHTDDALRVSLETLREVTAGRLICVFGAGGNRDAQKRPLMGRTVESHADVAVVTSDNARFEEPQKIAADILSGFRLPGEARWIADRREAIEYALWLAEPDDCVIVAGRGHEAFQQIAGNMVPLDDRDVVRRYLYNLAPHSQYGGLMSVGNS